MSALGGAALLLASCGGGGSDAGGMYVESCTLGCTNGKGGAQVSCGIINTFQNQDVSVVFSQPVSAASLFSNNAFQVFDTVTGGSPPGSRLVDAANPRRAIFRPKLSFDSAGNPNFGFGDAQTYLILIPGTKQSDTGPYVESVGGQENRSRMLCTIRTDQGLTDAVPGAPQVSVFVRVLGQTAPVNLETTQNVVNVLTNSSITFVFNDLMNIGTVVQPSTGQAPFITVKTDADGDLGTTTDQVTVGGSYTFSVDQSNLRTTAVFTPTGGFPSAGTGIPPRRIVVNCPTALRDLAGNNLANAGKRDFVPQVVNFNPVTLPPGGEQFVTTTYLDTQRSGADWGVTTAGRLQAGTGGGSGRLGDLILSGTQLRTLSTSPQKATVRIPFTRNIRASDAAQLMLNNGTVLSWKKQLTPLPEEIQATDFLADTLANTVRFIESNPIGDPQLALVDASIETANTLVLTYSTTGTAGNGFSLSVFSSDLTLFSISNQERLDAVDPADTNWPGGNIPYFRRVTSGGLTNGLDAASSAEALLPLVRKQNMLTNLAFGDPIPDPVITDGVLEFTRIELGDGTNLRALGDNPARLFARGAFVMSDTATFSIAGSDLSVHPSQATFGQLGALGGPGGGRGGQGADRPDNTGSTLLSLTNGGTAQNPIVNRGILSPGAVVDGRDGEGVGGASGFGGVTDLGSGQGGVHWPNVLPTETTTYGELDPAGSNCDSQQVGGAGSGGGFATDGAVGHSVSNVASGSLGSANAPTDTPGGDSSTVGLEPSTAPGPKRALTPSLGYLRGGSGGGGGGSHVYDTGTSGTSAGVCLTLPINVYRSHSGAGGGGGGGAIQIVAGRIIQLGGRIDASGGDGGDFDAAGPTYGLVTMPGGGGAGGAILLQSETVDVAPLPSRLLVGGGFGGTGPSLSGNVPAGGDGGVGLVHIDDNTGLTATEAAISVAPTDSGDPTSSRWLSVSTWSPQTSGTEAYSGAQSCWIRVTGNFLSLTFDTDAPNNPGWDMDLYLDLGASGVQVVSYRNSTVFGGNSPEQHWGSLIDDGTLVPPQTGAPIIVRFQGAKVVGDLTNPCAVDEFNGLQVVAGSLTPWVMHPAELNLQSPAPDMVRFQIVFDRSHPDAALIHGITNFHITATPD